MSADAQEEVPPLRRATLGSGRDDGGFASYAIAVVIIFTLLKPPTLFNNDHSSANVAEALANPNALLPMRVFALCPIQH